MSCGIENPQPIEECTGPSQCCPSNRRHGGTEEQENADGSYSARHLVRISLVGARARAVFHLLTILKLEKRNLWPLALNSRRCCHQGRPLIRWFVASKARRPVRVLLIRLVVPRPS